jgi:hypothetical protein
MRKFTGTTAHFKDTNLIACFDSAINKVLQRWDVRLDGIQSRCYLCTCLCKGDKRGMLQVGDAFHNVSGREKKKIKKSGEALRFLFFVGV